MWNRAKAVILTPQSPYNYHYFEVKTDTTFHKGDQLTLEFDPLFIVQDGTREGVAVFTVTFGNDSIATETARFFSEGHQSVPIQDTAHSGIKTGAWLLLYAATTRQFHYIPSLSYHQYQANSYARAEANHCCACRFYQ